MTLLEEGKEFAIGTYEINLLSKQELEANFDILGQFCKYLDTAVDYNNDYALFNHLRSLKDLKVISKISFCHYDYYEFFVSNHLKCLGRDFIDIMLIHSNRGNWEELAKKMSTDTRFKETGVSNFNVKDIERYKELIGKYPTYNEIEISTSYLDSETISFCKEKGIKIIAYAILGGKYNAMWNISQYSLPFLMNFAAKHSDIVILRADSIKQCQYFYDVANHWDTFEDWNRSIEGASLYDAIADKLKSDSYKVIEPMRYSAPFVNKTLKGYRTYHLACGDNSVSYEKPLMKMVKAIEDEDMPKFEMLGDYLAYARYMFKQEYNNHVPYNPIYYYDWLIGDDSNYYAVYLTNSKGQLTKIVEDDTNIEIVKIIKENE